MIAKQRLADFFYTMGMASGFIYAPDIQDWLEKETELTYEEIFELESAIRKFSTAIRKAGN